MRTALWIDDDVMQAVKSLAKIDDKTVGQVISSLARKGLAPRSQEATSSGFPVFPVSADASPITLEMVRRADDDG